MNTDVSVVIPAYNAEKYLSGGLASVLAQSVPATQILIVDDGSQDGTLALARDLAAKHPQLTVLTQPNAGSGPARNTGLAQVTGAYLLFLDADDVLHENAIRDHLAAFETRPDAAMVFGSNDVIDAEGKLIVAKEGIVEDVTREDLAIRVTPCPSQCLYRTAAVREINGYDPAYRYSQDIDLNLRLIRVGGVYSHGIKVMDYRRHPGQSTSKAARIFFGHSRVLADNFGPSAPAPDADILRRATAKWHARYGKGQFRVGLGALKRGKFGDAKTAFHLAWLAAKARAAAR